jgi:transglutaminase/protease-like cytokinesis protein 3
MSPLEQGVKWVRIYVTFNGKTDDNFFPVNGGDRFSKSIVLRYGPGTYQVGIMTSKSDGKYSQYAVEHQVNILNSDRQVLDDIAPSCNIQSDDEEIIQLAQEITQGLQTDMEKTKAIHDWISSNIAYDVDSYFNGTYATKSWDALSVLHSKKGICFGYSNLTAALNRAAGIQAKVVIGQADVFMQGWQDHAWNKVYVDGRWVSMDTTWDAGGVDFSRRTFKFQLKDKYFDPKPEEFAKDHREK